MAFSPSSRSRSGYASALNNKSSAAVSINTTPTKSTSTTPSKPATTNNTTHTPSKPTTTSNQSPSPYSTSYTNSRYRTTNNRTSRRGLLLNNIWHCDCSPRLPAERFQTKKPGKNQGRWFYTCQRPNQDTSDFGRGRWSKRVEDAEGGGKSVETGTADSWGKGCGFFLWEDEAKMRGEGVVLGGGRSEVGDVDQDRGLEHGKTAAEIIAGMRRSGGQSAQAKQSRLEKQEAPTTPSKAPRGIVAENTSIYPQLPPTPDTRRSNGSNLFTNITGSNQIGTSAKPRATKDEELYGWSSDGDEVLTEMVDEFETPSRKAKEHRHQVVGVSGSSVSPAKRTFGEIDLTQQPGDVFTTPATSRKPTTSDSILDTPSKTAAGLISPQDTPTHTRQIGPGTPFSSQPPCLSDSILALFADHNHAIPPFLRAGLLYTLSLAESRTEGLRRARDTLRLSLQRKDVKIQELEARITGLENEVALGKTVADGLRIELEKTKGVERGRKGAGRRGGREARQGKLENDGNGVLGLGSQETVTGDDDGEETE